MRVLLVVPKIELQFQSLSAPLGALAIGSYLKQQGYQVRILDRNAEKSSLQDVLDEFVPQVVGLSVTFCLMITDAIEISRQMRAVGLPVVWGGAMATFAPQQVIEEHAADYVVCSEGEISFHELLQALENNTPVHDIAGLVYADAQGNVCCTPAREFAALENFPPTDWTLVDVNKYANPLHEYRCAVAIMASKGCPNQCSFCVNEGYHRCQHRKRAMEYVIQDIQQLAQLVDFDMIRFYDDWFYPNKADLREFCNRYRALNISAKWYCYQMVGRLTREDLKMMYDSGCRGIVYGIESGSPAVQKRMKKRIDLDKVPQEIAWCEEVGIRVQCGFMIGSPDETKDELRETVSLLKNITCTIKFVMKFVPVPGSADYRQLQQQGRLAPIMRLEDWTSVFGTYSEVGENYSNIPTKHLHVVQSYFNWQSFWGSKTGQHAHARGIVRSTFGNMARSGSRVFRVAWMSASSFAKIAWYRFAYPKILREYGLKWL
ncbi:MAG: B12-binding domain-containing radical SAM protein [Oscillospiraceae bacterium]|nr:B12-binding domain-containing radical SAM protein [Oscillospiraceae bacterium]